MYVFSGKPLQMKSGAVHSINVPGHKLSFKNVSNVVVQLLHSIKYSVEVPFSNLNSISESKAVGSYKVSDASHFFLLYFSTLYRSSNLYTVPNFQN
jgi:hypothetical protein